MADDCPAGEARVNPARHSDMLDASNNTHVTFPMTTHQQKAQEIAKEYIGIDEDSISNPVIMEAFSELQGIILRHFHEPGEESSPNLDALVEKYMRDVFHSRVYTGDALKQCALEWANEVQEKLDEASAKLQKLSRMIDLAQQADDAKSETEIACSATFMEAMAYQDRDMIAEERDQWKARAEKAERQLKEIMNEP